MSKLKHLLDENKIWARQMTEDDRDFFQNLARLQSPQYLWVGCSDSRITPALSIGLLPGELFVHRNIANLVVHTDMNCLSVMQFAVEALKVKHIIVCGHYNCGGVAAAFKNQRLGLIDNWLRHIQDIAKDYKDLLDTLPTDEEKLDSLCELNIIEQVTNVGETTIVQDAWMRGQELAVHGWIYRLDEGLFQDLSVTIESLADLTELRENSLRKRKKNGVGK
ncbi:MAG: carbonate dehydratase [Acidobacteriota bacterium]|nr:carbonate dehydratase [Acidobacteriota bacterium]